MKKIVLLLACVFLLASCDTPSNYSQVGKPLIINGQPYEARNIQLCEDSISCNVWIIIPKSETGSVTVGVSNTGGKNGVNNGAIVIE